MKGNVYEFQIPFMADTDPTGVMIDAAGTLLVPNGSQTYAGDVDAALVKINF